MHIHILDKQEVVLMIRKGETKDAETIARIKIDTWRKTYKNIFPDTLLENLEIQQETEKCLHNIASKEVIVCEKDGKVIAYCYYGIRKETSFPNYSGEIFALYVQNDCQEHGIGTKLLKEAIHNLSYEHSHILLWCAKENTRAISFYQKNGLEILGEEVEKIGGKNVEKVALGISTGSTEEDVSCNKQEKKAKEYCLRKSANYIENNENIAIYTNPDLIFLKEEPRIWFKQIIGHGELSKVPQKFINYLMQKEVIEEF